MRATAVPATSSPRATRRVRALAMALAALCVLIGFQASTATRASADALLSCDPNTVYGLNSTTNGSATSGVLSAIDVTTGAVTTVTTLPNNGNGLGISLGGTHAYAYSNATTNTLDDYDAAAGTVTPVPALDSNPVSSIRGAVDPANGIFYYGGTAVAAGGGATIRVGAYDTRSGTKLGQVGTITSAYNGAGGDFAFGRSGTMYLLIGTHIERINETLPTANGTAALSTTPLTVVAGITASPGLAFASNGYLYVSSGSSLYKIDPVSGAQVGGTVTMSGGFNPQDLASCTFPNSLTGSVTATDRQNPGDQFTVALSGGGLGTTGASGTTTGSGTGSTTVAGPVLGLGGNTYTATQSVPSGTTATDYTTAYACTAKNTQTGTTQTLASGTAPTAATSVDFTVPTNASNDVDCSFTNTPRMASLRLRIGLGAARADASDQFVVAVQRNGTVLNLTANSTTTGTDATVTAPSGRTGTTSVVAGGRSYDLTTRLSSGAASQLGQYGLQLTCMDANTLQTGLPNGAAYTGSISITPVAGADITCVATATATVPTVSVSAALGVARVDDGDQFTVALHDGTAAGPVLNGTGSSTTAGTGSAVTTGTGRTGSVTLSPNQAVTLTEAPTGHPAAYDAAVTCTDANHYQTGLPANAPFTGSLALTPAAGSAIACTVTSTLAPAALTVGITGPSAVAVGGTGTWNVVATNGGGATAPTAVQVRLPAGLTYSALSAGTPNTGWTCTASGSVSQGGQLLDCTGPALGGGSSGAFSFDAVPDASAGGTTAQLPASIDPTGGGQPVDPATCTGSGTPSAGCARSGGTVISAAAPTTAPSTAPSTSPSSAPAPAPSTPISAPTGGVRFTLAATGPATLTVGAPADYTLTVTNTGTGAGGSAVVAVRLPADTSLVSVTGATCTGDGRTLSCIVPGPIAAGGSVVVRVRLTPDAAAAGSAAALAARVDPAGSATPGDPASCTAAPTGAGCAVTTAPVVGPGVRLALGIAGPAHLTVGVPATYAVTVSNSGTGHARDAVVVLAVPAGLTFVSSSGAACTADGQTLTCRLQGDVAASGLSTFTVVLTPQPGTGGSVRLRGAVDPSGGSTPRDPAACTSTDAASGCAVSAARTPAVAVLRLSGTATPVDSAGSRVVAGDRIAFRYTVTDTSDDALTRLVVTGHGLGTLHCASTSLAPGASTTCTADRYTTTQADVDAGRVLRAAVATALLASCTAGHCPSVTSNRAETVTPVTVAAHLQAAQTVRIDDANRDGVADAGETARFTVLLTNTGTVTLHDVRITDPAAHLTCPSLTLAPGASMRCTGSRTVTTTDVAAGRVLSPATATGWGAGALHEVKATATAAVGTVPTRIGDRLATTGSVLVPTIGGAAALLLAGGALLLLALRRRQDAAIRATARHARV